MLFLRNDVTCPRFQMQMLQTTKKISESNSLYRTLTCRSGGREAVQLYDWNPVWNTATQRCQSAICPHTLQKPAPQNKPVLLWLHPLPKYPSNELFLQHLRPPTHDLKNNFQRRTDGQDWEREGDEKQRTCQELTSTPVASQAEEERMKAGRRLMGIEKINLKRR